MGKNIRRLRKEQGLTQEELADKAELQHSYIGGIERGERNISLLTVEKIANSLSVPPSHLFDANQINISRLKDINEIMKLYEILIKSRSLEEIKQLYKINKEILALLDFNYDQ